MQTVCRMLLQWDLRSTGMQGEVEDTAALLDQRHAHLLFAFEMVSWAHSHFLIF